jgi:hypothetical protein
MLEVFPMSKSTPKVAVSPRALLQRINRALAGDEEMVRKSRPRIIEGQTYYDHNVGEYYRIDFNRNFLVEPHVDLESLGKKLGVMHEWEALKED